MFCWIAPRSQELRHKRAQPRISKEGTFTPQRETPKPLTQTALLMEGPSRTIGIISLLVAMSRALLSGREQIHDRSIETWLLTVMGRGQSVDHG
jgi:hypothetical protein